MSNRLLEHLFWNANYILALAGLYVDKKCCLDVLSSEKRSFFFYKAYGTDVSNVELLAGCVCENGICWFSKDRLV